MAYFWAYRNQSDHLTDISYSFCFILVTTYFLLVNDQITSYHLILALMVVLWGIRLGGFLFYRIKKIGRDIRFDEFRGSKKGFLKFWILQSISIWIIVLPVIMGLKGATYEINYIAIGLWLVGWIMESIADFQKFKFRSTATPLLFIKTGLYKYIRHPNYLGEILVWIAIFWYVIPVLQGYQWLTVISPIWVVILLVGVSGIPLIEKTNLIKYASNSDFKDYTKKTWRLIPFIY